MEIIIQNLRQELITTNEPKNIKIKLLFRTLKRCNQKQISCLESETKMYKNSLHLNFRLMN